MRVQCIESVHCTAKGLILRVENIMKFNETAEFNNFWCNDKFKRVAGKSMIFRQNIIEISNMQFLVSGKFFN